MSDSRANNQSMAATESSAATTPPAANNLPPDSPRPTHVAANPTPKRAFAPLSIMIPTRASTPATPQPAATQMPQLQTPPAPSYAKKPSKVEKPLPSALPPAPIKVVGGLGESKSPVTSPDVIFSTANTLQIMTQPSPEGVKTPVTTPEYMISAKGDTQAAIQKVREFIIQCIDIPKLNESEKDQLQKIVGTPPHFGPIGLNAFNQEALLFTTPQGFTAIRTAILDLIATAMPEEKYEHEEDELDEQMAEAEKPQSTDRSFIEHLVKSSVDKLLEILCGLQNHKPVGTLLGLWAQIQPNAQNNQPAVIKEVKKSIIAMLKKYSQPDALDDAIAELLDAYGDANKFSQLIANSTLPNKVIDINKYPFELFINLFIKHVKDSDLKKYIATYAVNHLDIIPCLNKWMSRDSAYCMTLMRYFALILSGSELNTYAKMIARLELNTKVKPDLPTSFKQTVVRYGVISGKYDEAALNQMIATHKSKRPVSSASTSSSALFSSSTATAGTAPSTASLRATNAASSMSALAISTSSTHPNAMTDDSPKPHTP